jgi:hypothetical protein
MSTVLPGYDEWLEAPYMRMDDEPEEDEGAAVLQSAMRYLKPRADADQDLQETGEFEAYAELETAFERIACEYQCRFCGRAIARRKDQYCSRDCYVADREGY